MTAHQVAPATDKAAIYVYCIARAKSNRVFGPIGMDGREVYTLRDNRICAVVHDCQARPYESDVPETVEGWVLAHQLVVQEATGVFGEVLPMAFNMIVRGSADRGATENLRTWLAGRQDCLIRMLEKVTGKAEYGVQIFWNRQRVAEKLLQNDAKLRSMRDEAIIKPKGIAYMLQQKLARLTREAVEIRASSYVEDFYARIRQCVNEVRVDGLKKADGDEQMLLNLSCLMEKGSPALGNVLEGIQEVEGVSVRFTGPWPAYSFVNAG